MRSLFRRLNNTGIKVHISTFSKANLVREQKPFLEIVEKLKKQIEKLKIKGDKYEICPIDSTIITLTSKVLMVAGFKQVKLFTVWNETEKSLGESLLHFGQNHDCKYGKEMTESMGENQIAVMDRGFAAKSLIKEMITNNTYFVLRIKKNFKWEYQEESELVKLGKGKLRIDCRLVSFCDVESRKEYHLVTNLPKEGEKGISNEEIGAMYEKRWGIELL